MGCATGDVGLSVWLRTIASATIAVTPIETLTHWGIIHWVGEGSLPGREFIMRSFKNGGALGMVSPERMSWAATRRCFS